MLGQCRPKLRVDWDSPSTPLLGDSIDDTHRARDATVRVDDHLPFQARYFTGSQTCSNREKKDDAVAFGAVALTNLAQRSAYDRF